MHPDHRDPRPIYAQITDHYRERITLGILRSGERLPSVRELAVELSINPNTIQRAYRQLELEGWIATVPGKGCFVCDNDLLQEREKNRLLMTFDETTTALLALGATRDELIVRLRKGGNYHD